VRHPLGQCAGGGEGAATRSIGTHKVGIAELTDCRGTILLQAAPEIAAREPQKDGGASVMKTLELNRTINFFDGVTHQRACSLSGPSIKKE